MITRAGEIKGPFEMLVYFFQRFLVFTVGLRWALDPDKYDLNRKIRKVHLGLWKGRRLLGGARIIFPEDVNHTLTFSEAPFRAMLDSEVAGHLIQYRLNWIEVTRLYVLGKQDRGMLAKELFRAIYQYGMANGYPVLVMVVNDTLMTMFKRYRFAYKVVGAGGFKPANRAERANTNGNGLVPHYVVVLNLIASQATVTDKTLTFFNEGLREGIGSEVEDFDVLALWNSLAGLNPADVESLVHAEPSKSWTPDVVVAATAVGG